MIDYEIATGDARAAASLLAESEDDATEDLKLRVHEALAALEARETRMRELEAQHDEVAGRRTRWFVGWLLGSIWTVATFAVGRLVEKPTIMSAIIGVACFWGVSIALFIWARDSLTKTVMNRTLTGGTFVAFAANMLTLAGAIVGDLDHATAFAFEFVTIAAVLGVFTAAVDRRLLPAALVFAAGHLAARAWPDRRFDIMALAQLTLTINVMAIWRPRTMNELARPRPEDLAAGRQGTLERWFRQPPGTN
jgi:serine/threonine-protein kinase